MLKDALITDIAACLDSPGFMFRDPFLLVTHDDMVANDGRRTLLYIPEVESDQRKVRAPRPELPPGRTTRGETRKDTIETP